MADQYSMFLTTAPPLRRGSTPLPLKHQLRREEAVSEDCDWIPGVEEPALLPIGGTGLTRDDSGSQSAAGQSAYHSHGGALKIVLLGQNGVGKSSLALSLAGQSDRSLSVDSCGEGYECSVTVDDEDSKVVIFDNWKQDFSTLHSDVCILVFSVTDRRSFHRIAQLRLLLRESQPHTDHPGGQQERPCALPGNQRRSRRQSPFKGLISIFDR
ncbi:GTP-binding protein REM 2 isoform X4 [Pseudoliparis swirei]|uniref:GTP-binding protein REM 2 isoform X4 n=1 Tax=Pseudoliparis swirei TaxID=2059687 RepID=UPI0024BD6C30|nr:GTP-binding protein REM 2 isoform X4 [Pseudoliparis swirei]